MLTFRSLLSHTVVIPVWLAAGAMPVEAQRPAEFPFQYAAKVVCGLAVRATGTVALRQDYSTTINVHNPALDSLAIFLKSIVITLPPDGQTPQSPRKIKLDTLPPAFALATDCNDLRRRSNIRLAFFEGFVLIDSRISLDVVAVYSVLGGIDVVHVPERRRVQ